MGDAETFSYMEATKQIRSPEDVQVWEESDAYQEYLGFIIAIGDSIQGRKMSEEVEMSSCCRRLIGLLNILKKNIDLSPPEEIQSRYGNPAYRGWSSRLEDTATQLLEDLLCENEKLRAAVPELRNYLVDSFGNSTRIDYGTGHEMTFVMLLCCLFKIGALAETDKAAVGLKVFSAYMDTCRALQQTYRMEPAGSMGVWNLDDYQFVAFIWGAAQMGEKARLKPKAIPDPEMAQMLARENQFFACLAFIHQVKSGPFHEHSNQLWNISAVPNWTKVFTGLIKMYRAEVLCKFPVLQHALFGSILNLSKASCRNPKIPEPETRVDRPNATVPGIYSPRPGGVGPMSRLPDSISLPPGVPAPEVSPGITGRQSMLPGRSEQ